MIQISHGFGSNRQHLDPWGTGNQQTMSLSKAEGGRNCLLTSKKLTMLYLVSPYLIHEDKHAKAYSGPGNYFFG